MTDVDGFLLFVGLLVLMGLGYLTTLGACEGIRRARQPRNPKRH